MMNRRGFLRTVTGGLLAAPLAAEAQQAAGISRIGVLRPGAPTDPADRASLGAFVAGLQEAGYAPVQNVHVETRYAYEKLDRLPAIARELVALPVAAIVTSNPYATRAVRDATSTVPIVVALDYETDPIASGWIASLSRPGGHRLPGITLFTNFPAFGLLMAYGPNQPDAFRRSASQYVARILKGARPADLPVQRPEKFELVINLKTAKELGLTMPPSLLLRADHLIE